MALKDLSILVTETLDRYQHYNKDEFVLPADFKASVENINGYPVRYFTHTAIVERNDNKLIVLPNQWFAIASFFVDYKKELLLYKGYVAGLFSKDQFNAFRGNGHISQEDVERIAIEEQDKPFLIRFLTDYSWWRGGKTIDRGDYADSAILNLAGVINVSQAYVADLVDFFMENPDYIEIIQNAAISQSVNETVQKPEGVYRNHIYYGAPGTGKSWTIKEKTNGKPCFRTTFHPDSDYASFTGAYKPSKRAGGELTYNFVPQAFTNAYVESWKNPDKIHYLIIEEINRGNCAQIFGDIFQLLDRREDGYSEYSVDADTDLALYLESELSETPQYLTKMSELYGEVNNYRKIALPQNLYILATMNTSDQSLFPMDSAFKRRWHWEYIPIDYEDARKQYIEIDGTRYNWADFLSVVNPLIKKRTDSEDKQIGNRFVNSPDGIISFEQFRSKVLFYLWFEIYKDEYPGPDNIFRTSDDAKDQFTFGELFGNPDKGDEKKVKDLLLHLKVKPENENPAEVAEPAGE